MGNKITKTAFVVLTFLGTGLASAKSLEVSLSNIRIPAATVGTEFDVPIMVRIPDGTAGQGLARLFVRIVSQGNANVIAPVVDGNKVVTTYASGVLGFGAKINSFVRDLDNDSDLDAGDTGLADLGFCPNNSIGIGSVAVILTQRWKFTDVPPKGASITLKVQFPTIKSSGYLNSKETPFTAQTGIDGSITVSATTDDLAATQSALDSANGDGSGAYDSFYDIDKDGEITSCDLALVIEYLP